MSGEQQWQQPDFGQTPFDRSTPTEPPRSPDAPTAQKWYKYPGVMMGLLVASFVTGSLLNGPHSGENEPVQTPFPSSATPSPLATSARSKTPSSIPSPERSSTPAKTPLPSGIIFTANGDHGGVLSGPAITWDEGYRNVIRFICNDSVATASLAVENPGGHPVKPFKKKVRFASFLPRPCIGDTVNEHVREHPAEYYPGMLALILAKNKI